MRNVEMKADGDKLTITINLLKTLGLSKSGKSQIIASTDGDAAVETLRGQVKVGLNVYTPEK